MEPKFGTMKSQSWNDGQAEVQSGEWKDWQKDTLERAGREKTTPPLQSCC